MLSTPVVLLIFRRPELTARVLAAIARAKPQRLFVIADGPRPNRADEAEQCAVTRAVIDRVDWDCDVVKNYSAINLGCGLRPATGISWAFEHVEEAIILEDDCVPHPSFFRFCQELLERYRDDERVVHIGGSTYRRESSSIPGSYYFSCFNGAWGWATWRRAWQYFDLTLKLWPGLKSTSWLDDILGNEIALRYWSNEFERAYELGGDVSYWDHQWTFACWANSGLSIVPKHNLVSNVGCGKEATHTLCEYDPIGNLPTAEMAFPLIHPPTVLQKREMDRKFLEEILVPRLRPKPVTARRQLRRALSRFAPRPIKQSYRKLVSMISPSASQMLDVTRK